MVRHRRGRGEGSISLRLDGRWMGRVDLGWRNGKRQIKTCYGRTRREVSDRMKALLRSAQEGTLVRDERQTLAQFLGQWLKDVAQSRVRPATYISYEGTVRLHIVPELGNIRLTRLTPQHVQAWLATLERQGVTPASRRYARVVLRNALNTASRWSLVPRNVATLVDPPRATPRDIRPFTPEEARAFLEAVRGDSLEAFFAVALACGLRLGEALGLQWDDIDFERQTMHVRCALQRFGGDPAERRPLLVERKRLVAAVLDARMRGDALTAERLDADLARVRIALTAAKTQLQLMELKSARSRRVISLPARVVRCSVPGCGGAD